MDKTPYSYFSKEKKEAVLTKCAASKQAFRWKYYPRVLGGKKWAGTWILQRK